MRTQVFVMKLVAGLALSLATAGAIADDSEIFLGNTTSTVRPNILFILDTSGSMSTPVTSSTPYDPAVVYAGTCSTSNIYYVSGTPGTPPGCNAKSFPSAQLQCAAAVNPLAAAGFYQNQFARYQKISNSGGGTYGWTGTLNVNTGSDVDCQADYPSTSPWATVATSSSTTPTYTTATSAAANFWVNAGTARTTYTLFSGNYLNYWNGPRTVTQGTRLSIVKQAASNLVNSLSNVNVGLMRYSDNGGSGDAAAKGGMVVNAVSPIETNRTAMVSAIGSLNAAGYTPLSETLYEAYLYYAGKPVFFGVNSKAGGQLLPSVPESRVGHTAAGTQYESPITDACNPNYIVFLTDGLPTQDNEADTLIKALPNMATDGGACDATNAPPYTLPIWGPSATAGDCLRPLAQYMFKHDMSSTVAGTQAVKTFFIGFGGDPDLLTAFSYLQRAATDGGGAAYTAGDLTELQNVLGQIIKTIDTTARTFSAPTVAVNAFNRTQTLDDLYVSVFQPAANYHWPGNVKKYKFVNGNVVDANANAAVDPATGYFASNAQSFWSTSADGASVPVGGAASRLPSWDPSVPGGRVVYTYKGADNPGSATALLPFIPNNIALADVGAATPADRDTIVNYARGQDVGGADPSLSRHEMGDPLHSQPAVVVYGGSAASPNINDAVVYAATNDGFVHAIDVNSGAELWSFIPQDQLASMGDLYNNLPSSAKHYALDGNLKVLKYDENGDGVVAGNDRVILYFSEGRGGNRYYALDVTNKNQPLFLWTLGPAQMPAIGQSWSAPTLARVNVSGAVQNTQKIVLVIGGGYDPIEEISSYTVADGMGNALYFIDAVKGTVLWSASNSGPVSLTLPRMDHAIPSDVAVIDMNGDGFADRLYVGDMAGQLWRFDIYNGNTPANLVTGGVIASLGAHDDNPPTAANTRRFYNMPDAAPVQKPGLPPYMNIGIGSGYRGHPLDKTAQDRFYSVRDYEIFASLTQTAYNSHTIAHDADLVDITTNLTPTIPSNSPGWKLLLNQPGGWVGEKVLAASTTLNNAVLFTTYTPDVIAAASSCSIGQGGNRLYAVSVFDGSPIANLQGHNNQQIDDRSSQLKQGGIAPGVSVLWPDSNTGPGSSYCQAHPSAPGCDPNYCAANPTAAACVCAAHPGDPHCRPTACTSGVEVLGVCRSIWSRLKTYWNENNAQ